MKIQSTSREPPVVVVKQLNAKYNQEHKIYISKVYKSTDDI